MGPARRFVGGMIRKVQGPIPSAPKPADFQTVGTCGEEGMRGCHASLDFEPATVPTVMALRLLPARREAPFCRQLISQDATQNACLARSSKLACRSSETSTHNSRRTLPWPIEAASCPPRHRSRDQPPAPERDCESHPEFRACSETSGGRGVVARLLT